VVLTGQRRALLTLCTGAGKTAVAFQIAWRLWTAGWNKRGDFRRPKILFLADRNILVDDPMAKTFAPFGDARFGMKNPTTTPAHGAGSPEQVGALILLGWLIVVFS
jgi:type I restriction enzyme R subunit